MRNCLIIILKHNHYKLVNGVMFCFYVHLADALIFYTDAWIFTRANVSV